MAKSASDDAIGVLLVDPHPIFRAGLRKVLDSSSDVTILGEASDGKDALVQVEALVPDVVVMEINLPGIDGLQATRAIRLRVPRTAVVLLAAALDEEQLFQAIKAGAAAYHVKDVPINQLLDTVRRVGAGEYLINDSVLTRPIVASRVLRQFSMLPRAGDEVEALFALLSQREMEILDWIARGKSNKEIATQLGISDQTVKNHVTSILRKLAVNDRTQAVVYALRRGWVKLDDLG